MYHTGLLYGEKGDTPSNGDNGTQNLRNKVHDKLAGRHTTHEPKTQSDGRVKHTSRETIKGKNHHHEGHSKGKGNHGYERGSELCSRFEGNLSIVDTEPIDGKPRVDGTDTTIDKEPCADEFSQSLIGFLEVSLMVTIVDGLYFDSMEGKKGFWGCSRLWCVSQWGKTRAR